MTGAREKIMEVKYDSESDERTP
eukprot:SAG11_NODE_11613_length_749_cov_0.816923_2_plen_22_part_01